MRGIDIARKLSISTSALRHYESWGLVPKVERGENGYRIYTNEHEAYFECIRALNSGFGMDLVKKVMPLIIKGKVHDALWLINKAQVDLYNEKKTVEKTLEMLESKDVEELNANTKFSKKYFTIGDVAKEANVSPSAIRHWEKEGLLEAKRHHESGFRIYTSSDIKRVFIIRTIQRAVYFLDIVREVLAEIDKNNITQVKDMAIQSLEYIDNALLQQIKGMASLQKLLDIITEKSDKN